MSSFWCDRCMCYHDPMQCVTRFIDLRAEHLRHGREIARQRADADDEAEMLRVCGLSAGVAASQ